MAGLRTFYGLNSSLLFRWCDGESDFCIFSGAILYWSVNENTASLDNFIFNENTDVNKQCKTCTDSLPLKKSSHSSHTDTLSSNTKMYASMYMVFKFQFILPFPQLQHATRQRNITKYTTLCNDQTQRIVFTRDNSLIDISLSLSFILMIAFYLHFRHNLVIMTLFISIAISWHNL